MKEIAKDRNFESIIKDTIQNKRKVIAWHMVSGEVVKCELIAKAQRKTYNEIEFEVKQGHT